MESSRARNYDESGREGNERINSFIYLAEERNVETKRARGKPRESTLRCAATV